MNKTLKQIFEDGAVEQVPGFRISFRSYPFKIVSIVPAQPDRNGLLTFDIHSEYLCGMRYTTFATNYLYSKTFYENNTLEDVVKFIQEIFLNLENAIKSTQINE